MAAALKVIVAGHVDHGKSTLIGRLLHETDSLPARAVEDIDAVSRKRNVAFEWSFILDALQAERDQAITIDTTRVWFTWLGRRYNVIDSPGHWEFLPNMLSGASDADAAVLVVDALEGVSEQTLRHVQLLRFLDIRQVTVVINKMDALKYDGFRFRAAARDAESILNAAGIAPRFLIPISARDGVNLKIRSEEMPWYDGPTLLEALAQFTSTLPTTNAPLRFRVQDVYRYESARIAVGRVESGSVMVGDTVLISPVNLRARVRSIERWGGPKSEIANAGDSIGITFMESIFVRRGDVVSREDHPPTLEPTVSASCFWLDEVPPSAGEELTIEAGPTSARAVVGAVESAMDSSSLKQIDTSNIGRYALVDLRLQCSSLIPLDRHGFIRCSGGLVLLRGNDVVAGAVVKDIEPQTRQTVCPAEHAVTAAQRSRRNGHHGAIIWLTGISGAGKSTLATGLERALFAQNASAYVLDGDNIRSGLNSDLGYSEADRAENVRRVAQVAALFADAGMIVIVALISPMRRDRQIARERARCRFHEVYVRSDLPTCEARDAKGLYARARAGLLEDFTAISAPYEPPEEPDLIINTTDATVEQSIARLLSHVHSATALSAT